MQRGQSVWICGCSHALPHPCSVPSEAEERETGRTVGGWWEGKLVRSPPLQGEAGGASGKSAMGYPLDCSLRVKNKVQNIFLESVSVLDCVSSSIPLCKDRFSWSPKPYLGYESLIIPPRSALAKRSLQCASQRGSPFSSLARPAWALAVRGLVNVSDGRQCQQMLHVQSRTRKAGSP